MAVDFEIKFANVPALQCELDHTDLARRYLALLKQQYAQDSSPIFRDPKQYTLEYFKSLTDSAKDLLGWDWHRPSYDLAATKELHKSLEQYLANGYANIPEEHDDLLNELHFCLHAIESGSRRDSWLQIEWFNDQGFTLNADEYPAKFSLDFGAIRLQNPYVGHHPLFVYEQKDLKNIGQTCRFHDFVKPGINIVIAPRSGYKETFDWTSYLQWFQTHAPDFVADKGIDNLKKFTGHPIIGMVKNIHDLQNLIDLPLIKFESITFA